MTIFSGVSHPGVDGGHQAECAFLTAAPHPGSGAFKNSVSIDQLAAEQLGPQTRFPSFTLLVSSENKFSLSFTRSGVMIPGERSPAALYRQMFVQGSNREVEARIEDLRLGRSILDFVGDSAKRLERDLGPRDRGRLDQYFSSVRQLEDQLVRGEDWERRPKPKVAAPAPVDISDFRQLTARTRLMYAMVRMALETDSTRLVTLFINTASIVPDIPGVSHETHSLTHHGNRPETLEELRKIEEAQFGVLAELLAGLRDVTEGPETLLDRTMVLYGTCMGSATPTPTPTSRCSSPAAGSATASTWRSTGRTTTPCPTSSSPCSSASVSRPTGSPPALAPCAGWNRLDPVGEARLLLLGAPVEPSNSEIVSGACCSRADSSRISIQPSRPCAAGTGVNSPAPASVCCRIRRKMCFPRSSGRPAWFHWV